MEHYVYIRERRRGARLVKTPYQAIKFWVLASSAVREAVPIFKGKGLTTEAWRLPDGRLVDASVLSTDDVESRELLEQIADSLVHDHSAENMSRLEKLLREGRRE